MDFTEVAEALISEIANGLARTKGVSHDEILETDLASIHPRNGDKPIQMHVKDKDTFRVEDAEYSDFYPKNVPPMFIEHYGSLAFFNTVLDYANPVLDKLGLELGYTKLQLGKEPDDFDINIVIINKQPTQRELEHAKNGSEMHHSESGEVYLNLNTRVCMDPCWTRDPDVNQTIGEILTEVSNCCLEFIAVRGAAEETQKERAAFPEIKHARYVPERPLVLAPVY